MRCQWPTVIHYLVDQGSNLLLTCSGSKTRDEETAKSCGPCARALWSNVLGSIDIASSSGSVESRQVGLRFTYLRRGYSRFLLGIHTEAVQ